MTRRLWSRKVSIACASGLLFSAMIASPVLAAPSNDNFASSIMALPLPFSDTRSFVGATPQSGEPMATCFDHSVGSSVWYRFKPAQTMTVLADTFGSGFDTQIGIYTGTAVSALTQVACNSHTYQDFDLTSSVAWTATQNVIYRIQISRSYRGHTTDGMVRFHLTQTTPPANDKLSAPKVVTSLPFKSTFSNRSATSQGEPADQAACTHTGAQVWFRYTPASTMYVQVDTLQSDYASTLAVFKGTTLGALTPVICNQYTWGGYSGMQSLATFQAIAGQTYSIQIGGYKGSSGVTELVIRQVTPPANDSFAGAKPIAPPSGVDGYAFINRKATLQSGEKLPSCGSIGAVATLWFKFAVNSPNPDSPPTYSFDVRSAAYSFVAVYRGTTLANLVELGCATPTNIASTGPLANGIYFVQIGGLYGQTGQGALDLS